jgi:signal peptide peptidase SppA
MADMIEPERSARPGGPGLSYWLGTKFANQPLAMQLSAARWLESQIRERAFDSQIDLGASKFIGTRDHRSGYRVTDEGIAIVPVQGILVDRGDWLGDMGGWATSYEGLAEQFRRLGKDEAIKSVILDIDSAGGMVAGMLDVAAGELSDLKKKKRVYGIAANMAFSAAYAIGCVAHELFVTRSGGAGSIGVIAMHMNYGGMLEKSGVEPTILYAGSHKPDGNPYQPLSHAARAEWSREIDESYGLFVRHVAKHRGLDEQAVRDTEARTYMGERAVSAKLADGVKSFEELLEHIRKGSGSSARGQSKTGGRTVSDGNAPAAARPDYDAVIAAALTSIAANASANANPKPAAAAVETPAAAAAPAAPAAAAAPASAAADPRARIKAILGCEAAKKRQGLANHLALETDVSAEQAEAILNASAEEGAAAAGNPRGDALATAMANARNSGGVKPEASTVATRTSLADKIAAKYQKKAS